MTLEEFKEAVKQDLYGSSEEVNREIDECVDTDEMGYVQACYKDAQVNEAMGNTGAYRHAVNGASACLSMEYGF